MCQYLANVILDGVLSPLPPHSGLSAVAVRCGEGGSGGSDLARFVCPLWGCLVSAPSLGRSLLFTPTPLSWLA